MKILRIDGTFLLPPGFQGTTLEALAELVRFLGDPAAGCAEQPLTSVFGNARGNFYHNTTLGLRFSAVELSVHESVNGGPWRRLVDLKPPPRTHWDVAAVIK